MTTASNFAPQQSDLTPVQARDVQPYRWAQWCRIEDSEPFANDIVGVRPSDDGEHLWFMLETFNFLKAKPDDVLYLIPIAEVAT